MFDIGSSEFLLIVIVALVVIGPKDLPRALYKVGQIVGKARGMARHFRTGIDAMVREVELEELEKKWSAQNQRILDEHPQTEALPAPDGHAELVNPSEPVALSERPMEPLPPAQPTQSAFPGFPDPAGDKPRDGTRNETEA